MYEDRESWGEVWAALTQCLMKQEGEASAPSLSLIWVRAISPLLMLTPILFAFSNTSHTSFLSYTLVRNYKLPHYATIAIYWLPLCMHNTQLFIFDCYNCIFEVINNTLVWFMCSCKSSYKLADE